MNDQKYKENPNPETRLLSGIDDYIKSQREEIEKKKQHSQLGFEFAYKAGYVQGVCECVAAVGNEQNMGKKLLTEMNVNKDMAKQFAKPETYKTLEQGIFAQKQEHKLEQTQGIRR